MYRNASQADVVDSRKVRLSAPVMRMFSVGPPCVGETERVRQREVDLVRIHLSLVQFKWQICQMKFVHKTLHSAVEGPELTELDGLPPCPHRPQSVRTLLAIRRLPEGDRRGTMDHKMDSEDAACAIS